MQRILITTLVMALSAGSAVAAPPKFDEIVQKVEGKFTPGAVAAGQVVTLTITAEIAEGWYTYPLKQVDPNPIAESLVNKLTLPNEESGLTFGTVADPAKPKVKAEPDLGIKELHTLPGTSTWAVKAKVSSDLKPGTYSFKAKLRMQVCGKPAGALMDVCLIPKTVEVPLVLTVVSGR